MEERYTLCFPFNSVKETSQSVLSIIWKIMSHRSVSLAAVGLKFSRFVLVSLFRHIIWSLLPIWITEAVKNIHLKKTKLSHICMLPSACFVLVSTWPRGHSSHLIPLSSHYPLCPSCCPIICGVWINPRQRRSKVIEHKGFYLFSMLTLNCRHTKSQWWVVCTVVQIISFTYCKVLRKDSAVCSWQD